MKKNYSGFAMFLHQRSEIIYLSPIIPILISLVISLATSSIYNLNAAEYHACSYNNEDEYLDRYLSGTIIINYIFLLIYVNILMDLISFLTHILISFSLLLLYCLMGVIWHALGISWLQNSKCKETKYYQISQANIIIGYVCVMIFVFLSIFKIFAAKKQKVQPMEENIEINEKNPENEEKLIVEEKQENSNQPQNKPKDDIDELLNELNDNPITQQKSGDNHENEGGD